MELVGKSGWGRYRVVTITRLMDGVRLKSSITTHRWDLGSLDPHFDCEVSVEVMSDTWFRVLWSTGRISSGKESGGA